MDESMLGLALTANQQIKRLVPKLSKPENEVNPVYIDLFNQVMVSDVQYEVVNYILEKLRILGATSDDVKTSTAYSSAVKLFPRIESQVNFLLVILSNWPWIITSQFKMSNPDARARVMEILNYFLTWSRECGSVYNHVVRVIYLSTPGLWSDILSRFVDVKDEIRSLCIKIANLLLKTRDVAPLVCDLQQCLADRLLYDPVPAIRMEALSATIDVASVYIQRICNPYLIKALSSRIGDKEVAIRMEAIKGVGICFKDMLLINNPKVIKVQHLFKMSSAILWLYKDKVSITRTMKKSWRSLDQKISKLKLSTGSPIDLLDQDADATLDAVQDDGDESDHEEPIERSPNEDVPEKSPNDEQAAEEVNVPDAETPTATESVFKISEMERSAIETTLSDYLVDVTNEDSETKSANILILITYLDAKALTSFSHLLFSQLKLRKDIVRLLSSTRADESFYSSFKTICSKFDYLDDTEDNLKKILIDLRNNYELLDKLEALFSCELSLKDAVEVANQFVLMDSSSTQSSSSSEGSERISLKGHMINRSGVFFMDKETLITTLNLIKTLDKSLQVRMASFILNMTVCYAHFFHDQDVINSLMSLNKRIHIILTRSNGVHLNHLPETICNLLNASVNKYFKEKRDRNESRSFLSDPSSTSSSSTKSVGT